LFSASHYCIRIKPFNNNNKRTHFTELKSYAILVPEALPSSFDLEGIGALQYDKHERMLQQCTTATHSGAVCSWAAFGLPDQQPAVATATFLGFRVETFNIAKCSGINLNF
jgi:hypothetical protein